MLFDLNTSFGVWPFQRFPFDSLGQLADHLFAEGIQHALVSHLGGVFYPDPDPFNRELFEAAASVQRVTPVPVLNPAFPGWENLLNAYGELLELKAVKVLPSFHNYRLASDVMEPLARYLTDRAIPLLIQMRLEDERMQYFALRVQGVSVDDVVAFQHRFPDLRTICLNAYLPEARRIGQETARVGVDTAFAEWQFTMEELLEYLPVSRLYFGSHTPFLYTRASAMKLRQAPIDESIRQQVSSGNAERLLQ